MYLSSTYFKCLFSLYLYFLCIVSINEWDWLSGYILTNSGLSLPPPRGRPCDALSLCSPMWHCGCSLFSSFPHFLSLFPYFPLFPITAILDKLALLLIPVGEMVSPTAAVKGRGLSHSRSGVNMVCTTSPPPPVFTESVWAAAGTWLTHSLTCEAIWQIKNCLNKDQLSKLDSCEFKLEIWTRGLGSWSRSWKKNQTKRWGWKTTRK